MLTRRTWASQAANLAPLGQLLRRPRQQGSLTQHKLSIVTGYYKSHISPSRPRESATSALAGRCWPALHLEAEPGWPA